MDREIKDLINEYGEDIFPYLKIRAKHTQGLTILIEKDFISDEEIHTLCDSGFIRCADSDDNLLITLAETDERWLYQPKNQRVYERKDKTSYVPQNLIDLAEIVGYPVDWVNKSGKYLKNFNLLTSKVDLSIIKQVAKFTKETYPEYDLNTFLTNSWFLSLKSQMENPNKQTEVGGRVSSANYNEEDQLF